jgi:hypothetical protein
MTPEARSADGAAALADMAARRAAHRRRRLLEVARELADPRLTAGRLRDHARYEGLEPSLADCRDVLAELDLPPEGPGGPQPVRPVEGLAWLILQAAKALKGPFRLEDLIVACWRRWPASFGLAGYPQYPDAHRVRCTIYGRRGLWRRGCLVRATDGWRLGEEPG